MSGAAIPPSRGLAGQTWLRWGASLLLVLAVHAAALMTLRRSVPAPGTAAPEPIMIDLAPEPTAPPEPPAPTPAVANPTPPEPTPPDPKPPEPTPPDPAPPEPPPPEPAPLPPPDPTPPVPQAEVPLPLAPPPKPRPPPRPRPAVTQQPTAPVTTAAPATPPAPTIADTAASALAGQMAATWEGQLAAHLARFKRFPPAALRRGEQGVVLMRLTLTHGGSVIAMAMVRGSGYPDLDDEAKAWIERAQPLPAAPPEIKAQQVEITVPLRFTLR